MKPISVHQLNNYLGRVLATDPLLQEVAVTGEISNLKFHQTGHVFFAVKDSRSKLDCFLPASRVDRFRDQLSEGAEVVLHGSVRVYEPRGSYSLQVVEVESAGMGDLAIAFEKMKQRLEQEGLFDMDHKQPLPTFPKNVGIVTAKTGAAVQDMIRILTGRNNYVDIYVFPVTVQGDRAAGEIAYTIDWINEHHPEMDVLIVGRGGGSQEDLWAFNEEAVARSIYNSRIPIISAVGHEVDVTIADFVADVRGATPTDAANLAVPDTGEIRAGIHQSMDAMTRRMGDLATMARHRLESKNIALQKELLLARIARERMKVQGLYRSLEDTNPEKVLSRGFVLVRDDKGKPITSAAKVSTNQPISLRWQDGTKTAIVTEDGTKKEG